MTNQRCIEAIVFLERNTFSVQFRKPSFDHVWTDYGGTAPVEVVERLQDATIVICNKFPLRASVLSQLPKLKLIAVAATGVDNIDLEFCRPNGITVCNTRGYATSSLPEHALMLMLVLRRSLVAYRSDVLDGRWSVAKQFCLLDHPIADLKGSVLGVIGFGKLGQAMAQLGKAIGMDLLIAERKNASELREGRTAFSQVLQEGDVISLHCPLTDETKNLIGIEELRQMKPDAILINTARGALVDDGALLQALIERKLGGAGIDVLREEPPKSGNPLVQTNLPNLIVTPHNAWASRQAMQTLADQVVDNLEAFVRGVPRNVVT
jgi:glycerate dehydrogenase